eukprot:gene7017-12642_t
MTQSRANGLQSQNKEEAHSQGITQNNTEDRSSNTGQEVFSCKEKYELPFEKYIKALRPWSFSASIVPVILGTVIAWKETHNLSIVSALLACISILTVHGAGNLVNTYYDFIRGIDSKESDDKTLVNKVLQPDEVVRFGVGIYIIGCLAFLGTLLTCPARVDHLALLFFAGMSGSFLYTGSIGLKYYALGDLVIILTFGPISVLYAYLVQCHHLSISPLLYAIPLVMNTEAILHSNNTRDIKADLQANVLTLAIMLGFKLSGKVETSCNGKLCMPSEVLIKINDDRQMDEQVINEEPADDEVEKEGLLIDNGADLPCIALVSGSMGYSKEVQSDNDQEDISQNKTECRENFSSVGQPPMLPNIVVAFHDYHDSQEMEATSEESYENHDIVQGRDEDAVADGNDDDDNEDSIASHFRATVRKRGSVTVDRKRPASPRRRTSRSISQNIQESEPLKASKAIISPLSRLTVQAKKELPKKSIAQFRSTLDVAANYARSPEHARCLSLALDRMKTQIPHSLELDIREEAFSVLQDTAQAYRRLLGMKHHLTSEANDFINSW